jgi:hypothetical protein
MSRKFEARINRNTSSKIDHSRFARFFLIQHTRTGKIYQMTTRYTKSPQDIPNDHEIYQITSRYAKSPQDIPNDHEIYQMTMRYTK